MIFVRKGESNGIALSRVSVECYNTNDYSFKLTFTRSQTKESKTLSVTDYLFQTSTFTAYFEEDEPEDLINGVVSLGPSKTQYDVLLEAVHKTDPTIRHRLYFDTASVL